MAPKRKQNNPKFNTSNKKLSKSEIEKKICKRKLDSLEGDELLNRDDRFTNDEKRRLIDAYNDHGFHIFQNPSKLLEYLPNRRESDIKGLIQRLQNSLQYEQTNNEPIYLKDWKKLCDKMLDNFSKDKKINMDQVFADVLKLEAEQTRTTEEHRSSEEMPDYSELLDSFSHLIMGHFPERMSPINAKISIHMFQHVNEVAELICAQNPFHSLSDGTWLEETVHNRRKQQELALKGLESIDGKTKKCPTFRDIETNSNIEALCLELPKIRRVTDVLNPLHIDGLSKKYSEIIMKSLGS